MRLEKLTERNQSEFFGKTIYCYEKSLSDLEELCEKFNWYGRIAGIIDMSVRSHGKFSFHGQEIPVFGLDRLRELKQENSRVVITSDYPMEAYEILQKELSGCIPTIYYFENRRTETEAEYRRRYERHPLEDIILFRSGPQGGSYVEADDFSDNARALFEYMMSNGYNRKWKLVWLVKDPERFAGRQEENVEFLSFDWALSGTKEEEERYYHALCLAKFIFTTDAYGFAKARRKDQCLVQLWHGCGFKTRVNFVRCEKRYDYMTVISDLYAEIHEQIYGLRKEQLLVTGYAKQDWLYEESDQSLLERLEIPKADQYIFWCPTFRTSKGSFRYLNEQKEPSETGLSLVDSFQKMEMVNTLLKKGKTVLVVKLHPLQDETEVHCSGFSNIILLDNHRLCREGMEINQLLPMSAALISDYSSTAVDYMLLNRPIAFTLDDLESYEKNRGFVFKPIREWLPGKELDSFEDFCGFLSEIIRGEDSIREKRERLCIKMHKFHNKGNCRRILDALGIRVEAGA